MVSPSDGLHGQLLEGFTTSHWSVHDQLLGGSWSTAQGGSLAATGGFMDSTSDRAHGWLLGGVHSQ